MPSNTPVHSGISATTARVILDSPAGLAAAMAFLAAGWHVDAPVSRAALANPDPTVMHAPVRLDITFGHPNGNPIAHRVESFSFASVADMVAALTSRSGQEFLAGIATFARSGLTATIVTNPAPHDERQDVASLGRYEQRLPH